MVNVQCDTLNDIQITLSPTNAAGGAAPIDAAASTWRITDGAKATILFPEDKLSCKVTTNGGENFQVSCDIDVDLGDGVETISEVFDCVITEAKASQLNPSVTLVPKA